MSWDIYVKREKTQLSSDPWTQYGHTLYRIISGFLSKDVTDYSWKWGKEGGGGINASTLGRAV